MPRSAHEPASGLLGLWLGVVGVAMLLVAGLGWPGEQAPASPSVCYDQGWEERERGLKELAQATAAAGDAAPHRAAARRHFEEAARLFTAAASGAKEAAPLGTTLPRDAEAAAGARCA